MMNKKVLIIVLSCLFVAAGCGGGQPPAAGDSGADSAAMPADAAPLAPDRSTPADTATSAVDTASREIRLELDKASYRAGDAVTITAVNEGGATFAFNPCTRVLERQVDSRWTVVDEPGRVCTMEAWILAPRERRDGPTELPGGLEAGTYRIAVSFTRERPPGAPSLRIASAPFSLRP